MLEVVKQKLEEILDKEVVINDNVLSVNEICNFENKFQIQLPEEYKDFLRDYVEVYVNDNYKFQMSEKSTITPNDGFESMDYLYSADFILKAEQFFSNYGKEMIPIGEASGDIICMGIQGERYGKVYYFYHENESIEQNYYLIAESFNEFILSFEKWVEDIINLDEIEIELDDDLWND